MSFVQAGTTPERLVLAVAATADANGLITFRVGPAPLGYVWQGSVTITNAPSGALFNSSVASTPWGQHAGPTNFGPVQLWGNETLVVTGVGLQKNTQYSMLFFGVSLPERLATPLPPVAPISTVSVETSTLLVANQTMVASVTVAVVTPPVLTRRLTLIIDSTNATQAGQIVLVGNQSNVVYGSAIVKVGQFQTVPVFFAIEPAVDQTYSLQFTGGLGSVQMWVLASPTNPLVETNSASPLAVVGSGLTGTVPINVAGSPVGPFKNAFAVALGGGNNQQLISAQGAGLSIYLQTITMGNPAATAAATVEGQVHAAGGTTFAILDLAGGKQSDSMIYPGGFELPANTALQINIVTTTIGVTVAGTYAIGLSL